MFCLGPGGLESKEFRLYKAQDKVVEIGSRMGLAQYLIDAGKRNYSLAFNKNFIQGRTVTVVAAVCLYAACR
jgi:transcription factor IIIB subunit 2